MAIDWSKGSGRLTAGGKSLEWAAFGPEPGERPVIVMLHEGLGCLALWRDFPERLALETGHPVFVYSRAGYGQSDPAELPRPLDYMTREALDSLPGVLQSIGAPGYILLGHSDGATIAAVYAGSVEDQRLRGVILMAPHFFTEPMGLAEIAAAKTAFQTTNLKERMGKYHRDPEATFRGWNDAWLDPGFEAWNVEAVIDSFRVPVLAIQGKQDQYGTLAQLRAIETRSPAPVELAVLDGCRHSPQFDQPEATLAAIRTFVARLDAPQLSEVEAK
jgi:pimeloyl-ACP methyl ester carboxylesterase